jgi:nucleoside-diphosphate-sugar epimerase
MKTLFLTGGTGLVGSHVAERWVREGGQLRALCRPGGADPRPRGFLEGLGSEIVEGDLRTATEADLTGWMEGCDGVVHAAAVAYSTLPWAEVAALNIEGTRRVVAGALKAGVRRLVHLSSLAVHGDPETGALRPFERYARSKREAEAAATELVEGAGRPDGAISAPEKPPLHLVILRPGAVYGERDRLFTPAMARLLRGPVQLLPGGGRAPIPLIYAGNLAHAVILALAAPPSPDAQPRVTVFDLPSDHPVGQREVLERFAAHLPGTLRPIALPVPLAEMGARVLEEIGVRLPGAVELPMTRATRFAGRGHPFTSAPLREALGWVPPVSAEEGLRRTAIWWAERGAPAGGGR